MASRSLNRVILIGNLTRDPELKYTPTGTAVCSFGVATNRSWKTADGETKEETQYHRIVAWQKLAELCGKLLTKGRKIYLEGRIVYRTFTGRDGQQRTISEIVLDDFIVFGDGRKAAFEEEVSVEETKPPVEEPAGQPIPSEKTQAGKPAKDEPKEKKQDKNEDVNPDDIPF
ncbi:single-stranded DNA-binding protein [Candidatus Roizmanbacteria bacterium]|nr:single-stranded DNA-binding protein [Candidatus Roizmanbacteria bacterium]